MPEYTKKQLINLFDGQKEIQQYISSNFRAKKYFTNEEEHIKEYTNECIELGKTVFMKVERLNIIR
mgnify:CR=1 FL=1|tara:strand:- start:8883 stop:9080 length:198 start_codon:yes stop_codon:yes gene_type:complete